MRLFGIFNKGTQWQFLALDFRVKGRNSNDRGETATFDQYLAKMAEMGLYGCHTMWEMLELGCILGKEHLTEYSSAWERQKTHESKSYAARIDPKSQFWS